MIVDTCCMECGTEKTGIAPVAPRIQDHAKWPALLALCDGDEAKASFVLRKATAGTSR